MIDNKFKLIDITKNFGIPIAGVLAIIWTSFDVSRSISQFQHTQETKYIELNSKLDLIKAEFTSYNQQIDKKLIDIKEYIDNELQIEKLKLENYILRTKAKNPGIEFPEINK